MTVSHEEQGMALAIGASLAVFGVAALLAHAGVVLATHTSSAFKRYTAKQMVIAFLVVVASACGAGGRVVMRAATGVLRWWLVAVAAFACFSTVYVTYTEFPEVWLGTARFYNSNVGPWVHSAVIIPLQIMDILLRAVLPLWNAVWWFGKTLAAQGLLPIMLEQMSIVLKMATTLLSMVEHLTDSLLVFLTGFLCEGAACLHPERGVLDLLSPMGDVREFCALGVKLLRAMCSTLAAPLDLVLFPLMDLNLAEAVHNMGNAVVQLLVVIPRTSVVRCALADEGRFNLLMCSPDFAPFFHFLVAGISSLGQAVDNWANVAFLIVQTAVTGAPDVQCDTGGGGAVMLPDLVASDEVFRGAATVVVGLTEWLYAVTDGVTAVYMGHDNPGQAKMQAWPHPGMDVSMGVAAVTYSGTHELDVSSFSSGRTVGSMQTTAMLACNCSDDTLLGMRILCSILPMAGVPTAAALKDYLLQVLFSDTEAGRLYTCGGVDIYVKSVRWSYTRYASQDATLGSAGERTTLPTGDCIARGTCRELDATVWVVPRCGLERTANAQSACTAEAPCFPFCMAARPAGSGRDNLILARARRWREGLTVLGQDCAMATSSPGSVGANMEPAGNVSWTSTASSGVTGEMRLSAGMFASTYKKQECQRAPRVTSIVELGGVAQGSLAAAANVRLGGQPFAITGDTALMEVGAEGGGMGQAMSGAVQVERLMGNEIDAFSLHPLAQTLPSLQRALVPMSEAERTDTTRVTIPYSYGTTRIAATNSRNYVFYASNPSLDVFGAYFEYCGRKNSDDGEALAKMGLLASSSYSPMRVYRVAAYRRCATYSCGADLVRFTTIDGFDEDFDRSCDKRFNVSVVALEYLNEDNIAVMVQSSHVGEYNAVTQRFGGPLTSVKTYWLNPANMALRSTIWQTAVPSSNLAVLCPAMQRLPRVGTFTAELFNAGVFLMKTVTGAVVHTPGMVAVWRGGGGCPPVGRLATYHSVLGGCGAGLYSLDDFFDSMDDAAAVFWHSLSLIGKLVASTGPIERVGAPLARVLDGTSQYGAAMIDLWSARASIMTLTRVPVREQATALWASMQTAEEGGTRQQGLAYGSSVMGGWSRFTYKALSTMIIGVVRRLLDPAEAQSLTVSRVFEVLVGDLYDLKDDFETTITAKIRMGCAGLRLIFASSDGTSNPWADLVYYQCVATAELTSGLMMGVGLNVFTLIPMAKCVCKDSEGSDLGRYATETCAPRLPTSLLPTLYTIVNEARALGATVGLEDLQCARVLDHVKRQVASSLDLWFENQHLSLNALGNAVDYATTTWDSAGGRCEDFNGDAHVVVLVPQPVDYFARCAGTSMCKGAGGKCALEWQRFQEEMDRQGTALTKTTVRVVTESSFFPGEVDMSLALSMAVAAVEVPSSQGTCLARARTTPPDYALAVAELLGEGLRVQYWCAPLSSSSGVYRSEGGGGYGPTALPGSVISANFGDDTGRWVAVLVQMPGGDDAGQRVYLVNQTGLFVAPAFEDMLAPKQRLMRVNSMWTVAGGILVDLVIRHVIATGEGGGSTMGLDTLSEAVHLFLVPPLPGEGATNLSRPEGRWHGAGADLMQYGGGQYMYTRLGPVSDDYLFVPRGTAISLHRVRLRRSMNAAGTSLGLTLEETVELGVLGADMSLLGAGGGIMAAVSQSDRYVLSTNADGWNWLQETRLDSGGYVLGMYSSASVANDATIEGRCDALGCDGCSNLVAQRLCMAYSQCSVMRCVGTAVHQMRPLCGVGGLLRHWGEMALKSTQASWTVFTEMLGLLLELNLLSMREAYLLWPDDSFLCSVCQSKDATAQFFSILTSTINAAMQAGEPNIAYMYGGASNVDSNADAALTISSTALNGFLHQVALLPLFLMVAARQVTMCEVTGVIAMTDSEGFTLSLRPADKSSASDIIAGQCLTVGSEVLANYPGDSSKSVAATVASIVSNSAQLLLIRQIAPALHLMDASLAYVIGVVHSLGVLVMSHNMARCNPPTFNMSELLECACGDHRLQIPAASRGQGLEEGALWCTGVLSMIDSNSEPYLVYNRYTYAELQAMSAGLDEYARCLGASADGYKCLPPSPPNAADAEFFRQQGVTVVNVLVKCRENYAKKQWDPHAYVMFNRQYHHLFTKRLGYQIPIPEEDPFGIRECMQAETETPGGLSQRCHEEFLRHPDVMMREEDYWAYERVDSGKTGAQFTDGCLVFSGPADLGTPQFTECVDGGDLDGTKPACRLAGHVWSPLSENQVPVAGQHRVLSRGVYLDGLVQRLYHEARRRVVSAVEASLQRQELSGSSHIEMQFFSVEGDMLHQIMDCMFMGPYSRVDYWPIPPCSDVDGEEEECLTGPYWARDDAGLGAGRGVDPDSCRSMASLPYTCGSPSRQALMRYLVLNVLPGGGSDRNGSVIHETVMHTLREILSDWNHTSAFGCACPGGLNYSSQCCHKGAAWLNERLNKSYIPIDPQKVMQAMEDDMGDMYRKALEDIDPWRFYLDTVAPGEAEKYSVWNGSQRVQDEARFDPTRPVSTYTSREEALAPLQRADSVLWDVCHAALKQTFFTLPLGGGDDRVVFDPELSAFDGDPAKLEEYVRAFTHEAWLKSPLFRHYSPRHMPSDSHMCEHTAAVPYVPVLGRAVVFTPLKQQGVTLVSTQDLPAAHAYPAQLFRVGATNVCLCGWAVSGNDACVPPEEGQTRAQVCQIEGVVCVPPTWAFNRSQEAKILEHFSSSWHCPEMELSPHWGFMDAVATNEWLEDQNPSPAFSTSSRELLRHGRAGLRIGNVHAMSGGAAKEKVNPARRRVPLEHGRLTTCMPPPPLGDPEKLLMDELFPAAQAVEEGGAVAYCLRYVMETARLEVIRLLSNATSEEARQREVVEVWRRRCGAQLHLLHLCVNLGVYRPRLDPSPEERCPHFATPPASSNVYVTKECLVGANGGAVFYDPCRCMACVGNDQAVLDLGFIMQTERCRLRFDPRKMALDSPVPIGWVDGQHPLGVANMLIDPMDFARKMLGDPDAAGNTDAANPWWKAEGLMKDNSELCDGVLDWWPEEWAFPVGYHVTVPCEANDTAYRSFAQAFARDEEAPDTLVYQHDLLRDANLADTHFGVGGLCRRGSFGMPLVETNNMRYCTSMPFGPGAREDFAIPTGRTRGEFSWTEMKCAPSSRDLPWPDEGQWEGATGISGVYESSRRSVGTVPHMPLLETEKTYPARVEDMAPLGPWQEVRDGAWGRDDERLCQDFRLALCDGRTGSCPPGYTCRGRVCSGDRSKKCVDSSQCPGSQTCGGVCLETETHDCTRHSDCDDPRDMCTGMGRCVRPMLVVQNRLNGTENNVSVALATGAASCGSSGRNYSMVGGSYWGNTEEDLLRVHGMCSFENWFKYTDYYGASKASGGCAVSEGGVLRVNPRECSILNMERGAAGNQSRWWAPGAKRPDLMYLRPTNCDRDYERLEGFRQCAPVEGAATLRFSGDSLAPANDYNVYVKLHGDSNGEVLLADVPERADTSFGVLGLGGAIERVSDLDQSKGIRPFVPCALIGQCFAPPFTVNSLVVKRTTKDRFGARVAYPDTAVFKCGVFGLEDPDNLGCKLDLEVLPLYRAMCTTGAAEECKIILTPAAVAACESIRERYQPTNLERSNNLNGLRELFYGIRGFSTLEEYLGVTECVSKIYDSIQSQALSTSPGVLSKGLYYPFMFVLKELPFDWFYQCIVMSGVRVNDKTWREQDCVAYRERSKRAPGSYSPVSPEGDSHLTYLRYVRGGYTKQAVQSFINTWRTNTRQAVGDARKTVLGRLYGFERGVPLDRSYPECSSNRVWRIGPFGEDYSALYPHVTQLRAIIWNWFDPQTCRSTWHSTLIDTLPGVFGITQQNWDDVLSAPDPNVLEPQSPFVDKTLMDLIQEYMLEGMTAKSASKVVENDLGSIYYDTSAPMQYNLVERPLPRELIPTPSFKQGEVYTGGDESVGLVCAFKPENDPAFQGMSQLSACTAVDPNQAGVAGRVDSLKSCNGKVCSSVPKLAKRRGLYNCRYRDAKDGSIVEMTDCTETMGRECAPRVMQAMYKSVMETYVASQTGGTASPRLAASSFPWFETGALFRNGDWSFNLTIELDYERNIQPNPELSVMCEITSTPEASIQFTRCNNTHYSKLKSHVNRHYRRLGAVVVPSGAQLEWPVDRGVLEGGIILSYAGRTRPLNLTYMDALFDDDNVCKGVVTGTQRVCWKQDELKFVSINPWLLGNFNPFEVCDVDFTDSSEGAKEYVYMQCLKEGRPTGRCERFLDKPVSKQCQPINRKLVTFPGVPRSVAGETLEYNLCFHRLKENPDGCLHDQGLLGEFDGSPVATGGEGVNMLSGSKYEDTETYITANSLYEESRWSIPEDFRQGVFGYGRNPLWHGERGPYGHLQIRPDDIGGHRIGVVVERDDPEEDTISVMRVERLPLGSPQTESGFLNGRVQSASQKTSEWVSGLQEAMAAEDTLARERHIPTEAEPLLGASCPLQRWVFYSGGSIIFAPRVPSPPRAQHLFHGIHGGKLAHPTMMTVQEEDAFIGEYRSVNGFCACPILPDIDQPQCRVSTTESSGTPCSLAQTINALRGGVTLESHVFDPLDDARAIRRCKMQVDWPAVSGTLRDGSTVNGDWSKASSPTHGKCHVLDRFLPFRYRYQRHTGPLREETSTTIDAGVCQTTRVVTLRRAAVPSVMAEAAGVPARCLRNSPLTPETESVNFVCDTRGSGSGAQFERRMPRMRRLSKAETLARMRERRQRCAQCSPPPSFKTAKGVNMPPESSFGRLYRHSVERMLAKDLQELLGAYGGRVPLNKSGWVSGEFMRNYMLSPEQLFAKAGVPPAPRTQQAPPGDDAQWSKPWVYCPTTKALKSGEGCQGSMSRADWVQRKTTLCPRMVRSFASSTQGSTMARSPFCSLDNTTDLVCKAIEEAKNLVIQANCIASGEDTCMPSPYVYHPATYVASNNAWVHESVRDFYIKTDPASCPSVTGVLESARRTDQLTEFARRYQNTCPANSLVLVKQILMVVRVIITEVALIVVTLVSMGFKILSLLVTGNVNNIKNMVLDDWAYVRARGQGMLSTVSDLLIDALLNSGPMGERIRWFLQGTCDRINQALHWALSVWCKYIMKYMIEVMAALKRLVGIIGAGFEMLQDFVDEIFQGVLPATFVAKYATQGFQTAMEARYSRPTSERDDRGNARKNVPTGAYARPVSRTARVRNYVGTAGKYLGSLASSPVGKLTGVLSVASLAYDIYNDVAKAKMDDYLSQFWPDNFTLFAFGDIVNKFDDMEMFLSDDTTCIVMRQYERLNMTTQIFPCLDNTLRRYVESNPVAGAVSIDATQCWTDASPSLGQNSLFACGSTSTCCETPTSCGDGARIPCGTCPEPSQLLTNRYGCDAVLRKCACGTPRVSVDRCSANMHCDAGAQCELVSSMSRVSYGSIPCRLCPARSQVLCLLKAERGMPGGCVCILDTAVQYDVCSDRSGTVTGVDASRLCGYLHGGGEVGNGWNFDMENLMVVACAQARTGVCSTVYNIGAAGGTLRMVVATSLRGQGGAARRRLLTSQTDDPPTHADEFETDLRYEVLEEVLKAEGWERAASPCGVLAKAFQGDARLLDNASFPMESSVLRKCALWRWIGRQALLRNNLTESVLSQAHETFLVSVDDAIQTIMADDGAGLVLARNLPGVLASALMFHPWMRPVRALGVMLANHVESLRWIREIDEDVHEPLFGGDEGGDEPDNGKESHDSLKDSEALPKQEANDSLSIPPGGARRRLLGVVQSAESVAEYSARIIANPESGTGRVPTRVAGAWSTSSFAWPPVYDYRAQTCPLALSGLEIGRSAVGVISLYFRNFKSPVPPKDRSLRGNLPTWSPWIDRVLLVAESPRNATRSWAAWAFHQVLAVANVHPSHLVAFFTAEHRWTLRWILETSIKCDLASTVTCSRHDKDSVMSTVIFVLGYVLLVRPVTRAFDVGFLAWMYILSYPGFMLWYAFGMPPSCFPMVPTCLLSDVIATVEMLVPPVLEFPEDLRCGVVGAGAVNHTCLRQCESLGFHGWEDPLAFAICDTDPRTCQYVRRAWPPETGYALVDEAVWAPMLSALERAEQAVVQGSVSGLAGHRLCTWVSFVTSTPVLALAGIGGVVLLAVIVFFLDLIPSVVALLGQVVVFASA